MSNRIFKPFAIVLGVFAAFCIICAFGDQGIEALASFTIGVGILLALLIAFGALKKKKALIIIPSIISAVYALMFVGVLNDVPSVIRHIQGEDFIGIWFKYAGVVLAITLVTEIVFVIVYSKIKAKAAKNMLYSDSDLMLIQDFDRFKLVGYYLLKAKLFNIIKYTVTEATEEVNSRVLVDINSDMTKQEFDEYCDKNPQIKKIVSYIKSKKHKANIKSKKHEAVQISVADVVYSVIPDPAIQSDGVRFVTDCVDKLKKITNIIFWIGVGLTYYFYTTKLMMGIYNDKPIGALVSVSVFGAGATILFYGLVCLLRKECVKNVFIKGLTKYKSSGYKKIDQLFKNTEFDNENMSDEDITHLLRAYAVYKYRPKEYTSVSGEKTHYSTAIFSAVVAAQAVAAAIAARSASSSSGCSGCGGGCSSCGGGCGSCGGCGGCGD